MKISSIAEQFIKFALDNLIWQFEQKPLCNDTMQISNAMESNLANMVCRELNYLLHHNIQLVHLSQNNILLTNLSKVL